MKSELRRIALVACCLLTALLACQAWATGDDPVFQSASQLPVDHDFVVPIFEANDKGAPALFDCFRKTYPSIPIAVFHYKRPPLSVVGSTELLTVGSYETSQEAKATVQAITPRVDQNKIKDCVMHTTLPSGGVAIKITGHIAAYSLLQVSGVGVQTLRSPLPRFDGIGHGAFVAGTDTSQAVVDYRPATSSKDALVLLNDYQAQFPDIHFSILQDGGLYYVAIAAFTNAETISRAQVLARLAGLYNFGLLEDIQPFNSAAKPQNQVPARIATLVPHGPLPTLLSINLNEAKDLPTIIERAYVGKSVADRVVRCYHDAVQANTFVANVSAPALQRVSACAGVVLTPQALTRCILGSDCNGVQISIDVDLNAEEVAKACFTASADDQSYRCAATTLDPAFIDALDFLGLRTCIDHPDSVVCQKPAEVVKNYCHGNPTQPLCNDEAQLDRFATRVSNAVECLMHGRCDSVVPRFGYTINDLSVDISKMGELGDSGFVPAVNGIEFLKDKDGMLAAFDQCKKLSVDATLDEAKKCFVKLGLNAQEQVFYDCLSSPPKGGNGALDCARTALPPSAQQMVDQARCLRAAGVGADMANIDKTRVAACGGVDIAAITKAQQAAVCAQNQPSATDVLMYCTDNVPPAMKNALQCAKKASSEADPRALASTCLPDGLGDKVATAECLVNAADDRAKFVCVSSFVGKVDPMTQRGIACTSQHASDGTTSDIVAGISSCMAGSVLPNGIPLAAKCLADAKTEVDEAICVASSTGVSPKAISTSACLAKSNGETEAMAMCAAGAALPQQLSKVAGCANQSTGETDFALCVAGGKLSPEWRIAAECASESGGQPYVFGACTAGRLTVRELTKCVNGRIGAEDGCFGPNNDVVKVFKTVGNDLTHGLGSNNDIVKAFDGVGGSIHDSFEDLANGGKGVIEKPLCNSTWRLLCN